MCFPTIGAQTAVYTKNKIERIIVLFKKQKVDLLFTVMCFAFSGKKSVFIFSLGKESDRMCAFEIQISKDTSFLLSRKVTVRQILV